MPSHAQFRAPKELARFTNPRGLAYDWALSRLVVSTGTRIYAITENGTVVPVAGADVPGFVDGKAEVARFHSPTGIAFGRNGLLYVCDYRNHAVRTVSPNGDVRTLAGGPMEGFRDGLAGEARFRYPMGLTVCRDGALLLCDRNNNAVRRVAPDGRVTTVAGGSSSGGHVDALGRQARFNAPVDIVQLQAGEDVPDGLARFIVSDMENHAIRLLKLPETELTRTQLLRSGSQGLAAGEVGPAAEVDREGGERDEGGALDDCASGYQAASESSTPLPASVESLQSPSSRDMSFGHTYTSLRSQELEAAAGGVDGVGSARDAVPRAPAPLGPELEAAVSTVVGMEPGPGDHVDGDSVTARLNWPTGLSLAEQGAVLISDSGNDSLRMFNLHTNEVSTLAGKMVQPAHDVFGWIAGVAVLESTDVVGCDSEGEIIWQFPTGGLLPAAAARHWWQPSRQFYNRCDAEARATVQVLLLLAARSAASMDNAGRRGSGGDCGEDAVAAQTTHWVPHLPREAWFRVMGNLRIAHLWARG